MYARLLKPQNNISFFLLGPRGTGKTTWVRNTFPKAVYIDLLEAEVFNELLANPQRLDSMIPARSENRIVIDEVQKIPELLNEVHRLIEKYKYQFVLTGSSARKLRRGGHNLLGGRALTYYLHPLSAAELGEDFDLARSLKFGCLPSAYLSEEPKTYLESYVRTYLQEEVRQEGLTRNLGAFARFLEAASFSQGSMLNISAVARESSVQRKVVEDYFSILEDLLIAYRIPVFTRKAKRRIVSHPKFYFFDAGVFRTLRPSGPLDLPEEMQGPALETLFLQELMAINDALQLNYKIYYWRTAVDVEVDFILYGERGLHAFELKRAGKVSKAMLGGLNLFLEDYPMAKAHLIYGGKRRLREERIEILPAEEAIRELPEILQQD